MKWEYKERWYNWIIWLSAASVGGVAFFGIMVWAEESGMRGWAPFWFGMGGGMIGVGVVLVLTWRLYFVPSESSLRKCENCKRDIGELEELCTFKGHTVCAECSKKLKVQE